mgnify:FL=1
MKKVFKVITATLIGYFINRLEFLLWAIGEQIYYKILFPDACRYKSDIWLLYTVMFLLNIAFCNLYVFVNSKKKRWQLFILYILLVITSYVLIM